MNKLYGHTSITRNVLKRREMCGIMFSDIRERRRDTNDHDGRVTYVRRSRAYSQGIGIHDQDQIEDRRVRGNEDRRPVAYQQRSFEQLHQQTQATQRQKIKPAIGWHLTTIENLVASGQLVQPWKVQPKPFGTRYPFLVYTDFCHMTSLCHPRMGTRGRCTHE